VGYDFCHTYFHTITVYFAARCYLYTHIHHGGNSSSGRIKKFNEKLGTISFKEFKVIFLTMVCELEFKYGTNYTEAFTFKQLACYVHYETLDVNE
jgi:hypothetical protein